MHKRGILNNPGNPQIQKIVVQTIIAILFAITSVNAQIVAVLEIIPNSEEVTLSITEFRHLTDELRTQAREALPRNYSVLTRDNIIQLMPPEASKEECFDENCAIEIGRAIGAEYVTQGFVGKFEGMLTLTVELYESMSGNLLGSFVTESENARGLLSTIRARSPSLFARIIPSGELKVESEEFKIQSENINSESNSQLSTLNSQLKEPAEKSRTPTFIALTLDVLGATAIGFGVYQYFNANKLYSNYEKRPDEYPKNEAELQKLENDKRAELRKANDAKSLQKIAYGVGGALLAAGITVHIWF
ncbi:MAG: hypothetical protein FWH22_02850 [Fibromonadales bacterium]|nr:hypothetical protein [Fibromonadales bacterium]